MRIAIVEDDRDQADWLMTWLSGNGYDCHVFGDAKSAMRAFQRDTFDLILLDWVLPDINGDELLKWIRDKIDWPIPVVFCTQRDEEEDIAYALDHGADDYVTKPIQPLVLKARIQALTRRISGGRNVATIERFGPYEVDMTRHQITVDGELVELTQKEFELAVFLFNHIGRLLSRSHLLESVWGHAEGLNTRTLDTHVSRLRKKLGFGPAGDWRLNAIYHQGYRLEGPVDVQQHSA